MYIVPIAWLYVALMMAVAEAVHPNGTVLGAVITFVLYGVVPVALVVYVMGAPARRRAIKAREAAEMAAAKMAAGELAAAEMAVPAAAHSVQPDAGRHSATDAVAPVREEP